MIDFDAEALRWKPSDDPVLAVFEGLWRVSAGRLEYAQRLALWAALYQRWGAKASARALAQDAALADPYWIPFADATEGFSPWVEVLPAHLERVALDIQNGSGSVLQIGTGDRGGIYATLSPYETIRFEPLWNGPPRGRVCLRWQGPRGAYFARDVWRAEDGQILFRVANG